MRSRRVTRRDFSRHWALSPAAVRVTRVLRGAAEAIDRLPAPLYPFLLAALAWAAARRPLGWVLALWAFLLADWAMLALLPHRNKSHGPPRSAGFVLAVPRALCALFPLPVALPLQVLGSALAFYALWIEPHRVGVSAEALRSPRLRGTRPLRILHLGDLHVERVTDRERQVVALAAALRPDLVLFSGDFLNTSYVGDPAAREACRWMLAHLQAPGGVFVVSGSAMADPEEAVRAVTAGLPVRWLRDERVALEIAGHAIDLLGIGCTHRPFVDRIQLERLVEGASDRFRILLYHTPDLAPDAAELGVDLMLSGHTHGGQVRLPWIGALFASSLYGKAFEMGRYALGGMTLYVTRGVGMEGGAAPRVRLLCPPEVVLWELSGG